MHLLKEKMVGYVKSWKGIKKHHLCYLVKLPIPAYLPNGGIKNQNPG